MVRVTAFLLVLSLALMAHGLSERKCVLTGNWINDLDSTMNISKLQENGSFNGTYLTVPSVSQEKVPKSPLLGFQQHTDQPTFGFTVKWNSTNSITVFTGQCLVDDKGKEVLKTMWLLRSRVDNIKDDWKATLVGTNTFTRVAPRKE